MKLKEIKEGRGEGGRERRRMGRERSLGYTHNPSKLRQNNLKFKASLGTHTPTHAHTHTHIPILSDVLLRRALIYDLRPSSGLMCLATDTYAHTHTHNGESLPVRDSVAFIHTHCSVLHTTLGPLQLPTPVFRSVKHYSTVPGISG